MTSDAMDDAALSALGNGGMACPGAGAFGRWRKKPVVIEAFQLTRERIEAELFDKVSLPWGVKCSSASYHPIDRTIRVVRYFIKTLEGSMEAKEGDWIIRGVAGEIYPCKPDIFAATYEAEP